MAAPTYLPFDDRPYALRVGLRPLDPNDWIEIDERYVSELSIKRNLLAHRYADVVACVDGAQAACDELLAELVMHLTRRFPTSFSLHHGVLHNHLTGDRWQLSDPGLDTIDLAGRLVQEDLCLMVPIDGRLVLGAASLCAPNRWRLADKLGQSMSEIHTPTPGYLDKIASATDRALDRLTVDTPVWRTNWGVYDDDIGFQGDVPHGGSETATTVTADNAGQACFLRVERQTLRRLPMSNAIVFTIRTYMHPISSFANIDDVRRLARAVRNLPDDFFVYKSLPIVADQLLAWIDTQVEAGRS
jgi:dimethylamine monooxygenase subunit A